MTSRAADQQVPQAAGVTSAVQNAHRRAARGIELRHSGHSRVVLSTSGSVLRRAISVFTGRTTKKNTAAAMLRKAMTALKKWP